MTNPLRERREVKTSDFGPGLTEQHHKKSTSMNFILDKYRKTGVMTHVNAQEASYTDYPDSISLHEAMNIVTTANSMFATLPSSIRKQFKNDAGQFLDFVQNEDNYDAIKEMGLSTDHLPNPHPVPVTEPIEVPVEAGSVTPPAE